MSKLRFTQSMFAHDFFARKIMKAKLLLKGDTFPAFASGRAEFPGEPSFLTPFGASKTADCSLGVMERNPQSANCRDINGNLSDSKKSNEKTRFGWKSARAGERAPLKSSRSRISDEIQWNSQAAESAAIKAFARQPKAFIVKLPLKIETARTNGWRNAKPSAKRIS